MITAKINGITVLVDEGTTILDAAKKVQIKIPTLCKHPDLPATAACGICIVKVAGNNKMLRACCTPVEQDMQIITQDPEIVEIRRTVLELILSKHPNECLTCGRNGNCELQTLAEDFGIREHLFENTVPDLKSDISTHTLVLEPQKCISCGRCVEVCQEIQHVWALSFLDRGFNTRISPAGDITLADSPCVKCGQCSAHCPTGAIFEYDETSRVWSMLRDPDKYCVVQFAPAVRAAIGEAFDLPLGSLLQNKLYTAFRRMGFKAVFDTNFAADVTIIEEASEFVKRFSTAPDRLPLITSCCPAWVNFLEEFHGDMVDNFSSCKSPQQMLGALAKTYFAEKLNIDPSKIFMVSIMPCTAKKDEIVREHMDSSGFQDVDISLTTRELSRMLKQAGIDFPNLPEDEPDSILGEYSGAGTIFGTTGGVMEAALRTAFHYVTGEELGNVEIDAVRGLKGVKEGNIQIGSSTIRVAVAHGLANVETVLHKVREARANGLETPYHFIEVMACPGGCVGGGGQPYGVTDALRKIRGESLYKDDRQSHKRRSHNNPYVKDLYRDFLGEPLSEKSEELLHTTYKRIPEYKK